MATNTFSDENSWEWSDPETDDIIRNTNEEEILPRVYEDEVQTGRGQKRKNQSDDEESSESEDEQGQYYYQLESSKKYPFQKIWYDSYGSQGTI